MKITDAHPLKQLITDMITNFPHNTCQSSCFIGKTDDRAIAITVYDIEGFECEYSEDFHDMSDEYFLPKPLNKDEKINIPDMHKLEQLINETIIDVVDFLPCQSSYLLGKTYDKAIVIHAYNIRGFECEYDKNFHEIDDRHFCLEPE